MSKTVLITGASGGIGSACVRLFAAEGYKVSIHYNTDKAAADKLKDELHGIGCEAVSVWADLRDEAAVNGMFAEIEAQLGEVDVLVNNAGLAVGLNPVQDGVVDDWERRIDTNVKGLRYVTRGVANYMKGRCSGHIVNLCSIAGKESYANGNVYCATKHAVDALTKGMRIDLLPYNIRVSQICPGAVETEFSVVRFKGDQERADNVYKGFTPLTAMDVADAIMYMVKCPPHVNINDMVIMPTAQANSYTFHKKL